MRKTDAIMLLRVLAAACLLAGAGCVKDGILPRRNFERFTETRELMGTFVTITLWAPSRQKAEDAINAAFDRIAYLEHMMSSYRADSEVARVNANAYEREVEVSPELMDVLDLSIQYGRLSGGAFDITMAPLWKLWKSAQRSGIQPDEAAIRSVLPSVGYQNIKLDRKKRTVRFLKPSMEIDLGGIAKGFAVDRALAELRRHGISAALVDAGGDIATMGSPPDTDGWRVGVRNPSDPGGCLPEVLHFTTGAVCTSGDYERYVEIGGKRFSHIIDPRTGTPVKDMTSVTVIAPDAAAADALATTCSVLGPVAGLNLAARLANVEVMYMVAADNGPPIVIKSLGFDDYVQH